jgi:ABC-type nitrate/sulfonate/bicarbonate transport system substrate-binding protein
MKRLSIIVGLGLILALAGPACSSGPTELIPVRFMLDWVPNTNHTGIFVAKARGYFEDAGLDVDIVQPGEVMAEAAVAGGAADFGISFQEQITLARADDIPIVSIAAVLQHNTSGFAVSGKFNVSGPAGFEGLRYGSFSSPFEEPTLEVLMNCAGGDFDELEIVNIGWADSLPLIAGGQIDMSWIFYGWQGFQAEQQDIDIDVVMMEDYFDCIPDYYTPVVIASESTIAERPEVVRALLKALSRGYEYATENPAAAAQLLLAAAPELDADLVKASQEWLASYYQAEAPSWGEQKASVWQDYAGWMVEHGILAAPIAAADAFTNDFLP